VTGFVDGEGCLSVSIHRNPGARSTGGWQVHPAFHVHRHERYRGVLEALIPLFSCVRLRPKGPSSACGRSPSTRSGISEDHVLPFFEHDPLVVKAGDFDRFSVIVTGMRRKEHLDPSGFERLVRLALATNANGKQRSRSIDEILTGSSETARQAPRAHAARW
jgi:hypothetical protein